jgi:protein-S-isoprenylcysteine O-methyltransferase Ste14
LTATAAAQILGDSVVSKLELKIPPLLFVVVIGGAMWLIARLIPHWWIDIPARFFIAVSILVAGLTFALAGVYEFRRAKTTVDPTKPQSSSAVVQSGVYRYSRNPMYLGFLLVLVAWSVYLANMGSALFIVVFVLYMNRFQIAPEERWLEEKFGPDYGSYTARVRRWV